MDSPTWRFQIQQGNNQQILLSQWQQGQRSQGEIQIQSSEGQPATINTSLADIAVDISSSENAVWNQQPQSNEEVPSPPPRPSAQTTNATNGPFSAISLFLEQNPEMYGILQTLLAYIPFVILILFKEIYKHTSGT